MSRVYLDYLQDMRDNAKRAIDFSAGLNNEAFSKDEKTIYAVIRAVEVIGEAASNIPEDIRSQYAEIPWREIKGMRNKLVHQYFGINMEVVWQTIQEDLPMIINVIDGVLKQEKEKE
jgi:uncharacterized protein with HEPN domain